MAVINFPDNPSDGATQTVGGITYTYSSSKGYWTAAASSGGGGGGGASVTTDDTAPSSPSDGDLWYDTDDGGMFVYYEDTDSSQWVEVIGSQGATGAAGADGGAGVASVYATIDALPLTGNTQGDMAHVTANNTLYFWNGSGWYKIALINTSPSISGVASAYALAIDGTATTVTVTASDPEGLPITYSIASDTSGNIATVSQGTGANTNVFTVTPSTNTAYAGSFSLTFRASDGVNIATAPATFTLQFIVPNSNYTSLLLTTDGSAGGVTTFTDSSSNSHTITPAGAPRQSTFSPYRHGGYSTFFDGTGDYLALPDDSSLEFGSGDFTIELWYYGADLDQYATLTSRGATSFTTGSWSLMMNHTNTGDLAFYCREVNASAASLHASSVNVTNDTWHHIAVVRNGTNLTLYVDGISSATTTTSATLADVGASIRIGYDEYYTRALGGYIADYRIVKGTAVYTANFTPPTERLTAISGTSVLTCHLPYFADGSTNNHTITPAGNVATIPFSPYDYQSEYAVGTHGGSAYLYGTSDWLSLPTAAGNLGTGDFTVELWAYHDDTTLGGQTYIDTRQTSGTDGWLLYVLGGAEYIRFYANGTAVLSPTSAVVRKNAWNHVALSRSSGTLRLFVNGVQHGAQTGNTSDYAAHNFNIGAKTYTASGAVPMKGDIADVRISTNARYTADFTPPTTAFTNDSNTQLLVSMQDAAIIDKSQTTTRVIPVGNTTASTTQYKYLPSSIYFDGADDGIRIPMASGVGATARLPGSFVANEDFTIEMWHYLTARTELYPCLFSNYTTSGASTLGLFAGHNSSTTTQYQVAVNGTFPAINAGTINYNQWVHVALVRSSGTITLYIDGTSVGTHSSNAALPGNGNWMGIGLSQDTPNDTNIQGYLSDVRITRGLARYTANFTPPTAALQG